MFRKQPFTISATITLEHSKRTYLYFGINYPKRNIALAVTVILGGSALSARMS